MPFGASSPATMWRPVITKNAIPTASAVRRRRGPASDEPLDRRLEEMRERGLPDPAQGERGHGDPELARGDVGVQVRHHLVRPDAPGIALARELLEAGPAHRDEGEFGRDEERRSPGRGRESRADRMPSTRSFPVIVRGRRQAPGHGAWGARAAAVQAQTRGRARSGRGGAVTPASESGRSQREAGYPRVRRSSRRSLYSTESTSACQDASMMLQATPTVPHVSSPSAEVMSTRVLAAVPLVSSRMRTL